MALQESRYDSERKELILTHCALSTLPPSLIDTYAQCTEYLDCSHNHLTDLSCLYSFENLKYLILDCNRLHEAHLYQWQWPMTKVKYLMLNRNELMDLSNTIEILSAVFPSLEYLSLHGNPICPDGLELQPFCEYVSYEYEFYRSSILHEFPNLKFLDHFDLQRSYRTINPPKHVNNFNFTPKSFLSKLMTTFPAFNRRSQKRATPKDENGLVTVLLQAQWSK